MYIKGGSYLSVKQYAKRLKYSSVVPVYAAIKSGRLEGALRIDKHVTIIPQDAIIIDARVRTGKYVGKRKWRRGEDMDEQNFQRWQQSQTKKIAEENVTET